jgi:hypothetical protein
MRSGRHAILWIALAAFASYLPVVIERSHAMTTI